MSQRRREPRDPPPIDRLLDRLNRAEAAQKRAADALATTLNDVRTALRDIREDDESEKRRNGTH